MDCADITQQLCEFVTFIMLMMAIKHGLGPHTSYAVKGGQTKVLQYIFGVQAVSFWTAHLSRISVATVLFRFDISKTWKVVLWILIYIQLAIAIRGEVFFVSHVPPSTCLLERRT
jgi:hypothetical protein